VGTTRGAVITVGMEITLVDERDGLKDATRAVSGRDVVFFTVTR
jgi:hypothetical protein